MATQKKGTVSDCISLGGKPWGKASDAPDETEFKCIFKNPTAVKKINSMTEYVDKHEDKTDRVVATTKYYKNKYSFDTTNSTLDRWLRVMGDHMITKKEANIGDQKVLTYKLGEKIL